MKRSNTVFSLYSGAGGMDIGFHKAGFNVAYSTDIYEPACETLIKNNIIGRVECCDIRSINFKNKLRELKVKEVDCLVGGPPCPAYSKSRFYLKDKKRAMEDENAFTLKEYFRAIKEVKPKVFLFENVHGFVYKPHLSAFKYLEDMSKKLGYRLSYKVVDTSRYGIPQTRERFFCVGVSKGLPDFVFPDETHYSPLNGKGKHNGKRPWVTCGDVLGDLDIKLPEDKNMIAGSKDYELLKKVPPGDNYLFFTEKRGHPNPIFEWRSRYWSFLLKLTPDRPSWTIQASHSNNMGPFHWRNRFLRISEIKRIQTFDDDYELCGDYRAQWRLVGNAVPPLMAKILAKEIKKQLLS